MFSPFPGMDPYLEGHLWPDVHDALANRIRRQLTPQLGSRYVARLEITVVQDVHPIFEMGIMYPDVKIVTTSAAHAPLPERSPAAAGVAAAPIKVPVLDPMPVRLVNVEIRDVLQNKLITAIEILSPVNKREPGLTKYLQKRQQLRQASVHLLELDLLRRGARPLAHPDLPEAAYFISLLRAGERDADVWPLQLSDSLPTVPVPLRQPDPDVALDLAAAIQGIYAEAAYQLSIDYDQSPPPPPLSAAEEAWWQVRYHAWREGKQHET